MNLKLTSLALLFFCLTPVHHVHAQLGIGTTTPDPNAALDIESTTQGVLIPRMNQAQRELIGGGTPAAGMLVYQTDDAAGFYFYDGSAWISLSTKTPSGLESIDEGNGNGLVRVGRDPINYGDIGLGAVDLSYSFAANLPYGATGNFSTAMGYITSASGIFSTAKGSLTTASGLGSTAMGSSTRASGNFSTALGQYTLAESFATTAIGSYNIGGGDPTSFIGTDSLFEIGNGTGFLSRSNALTVLKNGSVTAPSFDISEITDDKALITKEYAEANLKSSGMETVNEGNGNGLVKVGRDPNNYGNVGLDAVDLSHSDFESTTNGATGFSSTAMGLYTSASGAYSTAMGFATIASGLSSTAMGTYTLASGEFSTALGLGTQSESYASTALGRYNVGGGNPLFFAATDPLFEIGIGTSDFNRINAMTVLKNGNVGIGTTTPLQNLSVIGNAEVTGRLGIGTASPIAKLDVNGDIFANGFVYGNRIAFTGFQATAVDLQNINSPSTTLSLAFTDVTDNFNILNSGVFTAPRSGLYFFSCSLSFSNGDGLDDTMWFGFSVNGSSSMSTESIINPRTYTGSGREQAYSHSAVISLNGGNTVEVLIRDISATSPVKILNRTFTGYYLGDN